MSCNDPNVKCCGLKNNKLEPPCCVGRDCHLKRVPTRAEKNEISKEHNNYHALETKIIIVRDESGLTGSYPNKRVIEKRIRKYGIDKSKEHELILREVINTREKWLHKWFKTECFLCDANGRNHEGRIEQARESLDEYIKVHKNHDMAALSISSRTRSKSKSKSKSKSRKTLKLLPRTRPKSKSKSKSNSRSGIGMRPKLKLMPRTLPIRKTKSKSKSKSKSGIGMRPKLNLLPRTINVKELGQ
jgi:hypothetical protein